MSFEIIHFMLKNLHVVCFTSYFTHRLVTVGVMDFERDYRIRFLAFTKYDTMVQ